MNRRTFVSSLATAGAAVAATPKVLSAEAGREKTPTIGLVGCGWFGEVDLGYLVQVSGGEVVSLCDVNSHALEQLAEQVQQSQRNEPGRFSDFREMLASRKHDIVIVATPDHWHALPAIAAIEAGADVFLEKPTSVDVLEGEALVAAARKHNRVVQVNTQRRSWDLVRRVRDEFVRTGRLGRIGIAETFFFTGRWSPEPFVEKPVPAHLDYDFWTGPAPVMPFVGVQELRGWRNFMEYGNGFAGDMGVHMVDAARFMLDLGWPESVTGIGGIYVPEGWRGNRSDTLHAVMQYPGLRMSWEHRAWGASPIKARHWTENWGIRLVGTKGTLDMTSFMYQFTPRGGGGGEPELFHELAIDGDPTNPDYSKWEAGFDAPSMAHVRDFLDAREKRTRPVADVEENHISSSCCILANMSQQLGRSLSYDPATRTIPGDIEATNLLARPYRSPWKHPAEGLVSG